MTTAALRILEITPTSVAAVMSAFLLCLLTSYILSIVAGFRSERGTGLRGLLIFPITNPVAVLILLFRDPKAGALPLLCYGVTLLSLPLGGALAERIEKNRLHSAQHTLEQTGEQISVEALRSEPIPLDQNVWDHPYLAPLVIAGHPGPEGSNARESLSDHYDRMSLPPPQSLAKYVDETTSTSASRQRTYWQPFRSLHSYALSTQGGQQLLRNQKTPESWEECGALLLEHFLPLDADFASLTDAVNRPQHRYPYAWAEGFSLLLPNLAKLKSFTQCAVYRSIARTTQGEGDASYADIQTAMRLRKVDDSELLISRLVLWAQTTITLNGLLVAQQYHAWTEDQWAALQSELTTWDLPAQVPNSMRTERILGQVTIEPMLSLTTTEAQRFMDSLGALTPPNMSRKDVAVSTLRAFTDFMTSGLARAFLTSQWRLTLGAYSEFIANIEQALERSQTKPWKELQVNELSKPLHTYGILTQMLLPALGKAFDKALYAQNLVEIAIIACALERYYLTHGNYPNTLTDLVPQFLADLPLDPMTREDWRYEAVGDGFRLYSLGPNGVDDGGDYTPGGSRRGAPSPDDLAWVITSELPPLPVVKIDPPFIPTKGRFQPSAEMMERYGLIPSDNPNQIPDRQPPQGE